ncbi:hypothetical protein DPX16_19767 [Anabarilius grahami]|uniref:Uncharacterized protein n=1 Tax=Anabarilius grahami TaxID=495550 RepID=A0A3N0XQ63_ANAGA|nr:hypothetical protein DPX16_19767 [Anabarilius grahami]
MAHREIKTTGESMAGPCVDNLIDVFREDKAESFPQNLRWRKLSSTINGTGHGSRFERVWVSCSLISLCGLLPLSVSVSLLNNRQLWQMEPYPDRSREALDLKCKRTSSDGEEEEAMSQGSRRQGRLP